MAKNETIKSNMMTEENRKAVNAIMETMKDSNAHYGKGDTANALAVNRYFGDGVTVRAEAYIMATQIDIYAGNTTALYEYLKELKSEDVKVKVYSKELKATFKSIDTLKATITAYNATQKSATQKSKTATAKRSKTAKNAKKETKTA